MRGIAEEEAGGLRAAHALATGVADERGTGGEVDVGGDGLFGGGVDEDGDVFLLCHGADVGDGEGAGGGVGAREDVDHGDLIGEGGLELFGGVDFDDRGRRSCGRRSRRGCGSVWG